MVPDYPAWAEISLDLQPELGPAFSRLDSGVSEFSFAGIYLFRATYGYRVSRLAPGLYALSGQKAGRRFFNLPWGLPDSETLAALAASHDFLKGVSPGQVPGYAAALSSLGWQPRPDRDNWDYLYDSQEMTDLAGKKFHKKRNLIHQFLHEHARLDRRPLGPDTLEDARRVLQLWGEQHPEGGDTVAASEALGRCELLGLNGAVYYLEDRPVGYTLGEPLQQGRSYVIHFEKADNQVKGLYQALFRDWASTLVSRHPLINREQDLGDPGLRQAKETYRPCGFIEKTVFEPTNL